MIINDATVVRESAAITADYVVSDEYDVAQVNQLSISVDYTKDTEDGLTLMLEFHDTVDWTQETAQLISGGVSTETLLVHTYDASGNRRLDLPVNCLKVRASVKATGGTPTASSLCEIRMLKGNAS